MLWKAVVIKSVSFRYCGKGALYVVAYISHKEKVIFAQKVAFCFCMCVRVRSKQKDIS